jgi:AraC-like DNA-binding protein
MQSLRPTLREAEDSIRDLVHTRTTPLHIDDVASDLYVSRSTLQRVLADHGTTFTKLRQRAQIEIALGRLTEGKSCASTAVHVGLSRDHMSRLIAEHTDLTPRQIARVCQLADRLRRWRRSVPPRANTKLYFTQLKRWRAAETELGRLIADIPAGHPLTQWTNDIRRAVQRPDFRRRRYRTKVRAERRREEAVFTAQLRKAIAVATQLRQQEDVSPPSAKN